MEKLSVFVTTLNNDRTLAACLESVKWADEIVLLDSYSADRTLDIARAYGCTVFQHEFQGFGRQKQMAMEHTRNRWVLLMDADEALSAELIESMQRLLRKGPDAAGYEIPRQEQMFWRMASTRSRLNYFLRLMDKERARFTEQPVHAAPRVEGPIKRLHEPFYHYGEIDIHTKVEKVNNYSTGLVADKVAKGKRANPFVLLIYPPLFFIKIYFLKRNFLNGWAGFIASVVSAFYAFMKYAKLYEYQQVERYGTDLMPPGAPPYEPVWRKHKA